MNADPKPSLVIVGNGLASFACLERLVARGGVGAYQVRVLTEESRPAYDREHLAAYFAGRSAEEFLFALPAWYAEHGIELRTGERVVQLNRERQELVTTRGNFIPYDYCILATGAEPSMPNVPGLDAPGVFVYRTLDEVAAVARFARQSRSVAVLGGGRQALAVAVALHTLGLKCHVVESQSSLMSRQLPPAASELLRGELETLGLVVHTSRDLERISIPESGLTLEFGGGDRLETEMIVIAIDGRPRDELGRAAGLAGGVHGGIAVDSWLRTSDPQLHAIGACVSYYDTCYDDNAVEACRQMAQRLADQLADRTGGGSSTAQFYGAMKASRCLLGQVAVATLGATLAECPEARLLEYQVGQVYRALVVRGARLVGAVGVGSWPEGDRLAKWIPDQPRLTVAQLRRFRRSGCVGEPGAWWGPRDDQTLVCHCRQVTGGELDAALEMGYDQIDLLRTTTGAMTGCGTCRAAVIERLASAAVRRPLLVDADSSGSPIATWRRLLQSLRFKRRQS